MKLAHFTGTPEIIGLEFTEWANSGSYNILGLSHTPLNYVQMNNGPWELNFSLLVIYKER